MNDIDDRFRNHGCKNRRSKHIILCNFSFQMFQIIKSCRKTPDLNIDCVFVQFQQCAGVFLQVFCAKRKALAAVSLMASDLQMALFWSEMLTWLHVSQFLPRKEVI